MEAKTFTNTDKMPTMTTGFLPIRSAAIPQTVEVKHLPSINEAPKIVQKKFKTSYIYSTISHVNDSAIYED